MIQGANLPWTEALSHTDLEELSILGREAQKAWNKKGREHKAKPSRANPAE